MNMKQTKAAAWAAIVVCLTVILFFSLSLTGCGKKEGPQALSILLVHTSGREEPDLTNELVTKKVYDTIRSGGNVSVINVDGEPSRALSRSFALDERYKGASQRRLNADASAAATAFLKECSAVVADDPEVDLLGGFELASHELTSAVNCEKKTILIMDTGLSTAGDMDFRNQLIYAEPEELADLLEERSCIPDLEGISVEWLMTGAAGEQAISNAQAEQIKAIWEAVILRAGGDFSCHEIGTGVKTAASAVLPSVSVVKLPQAAPIRFDAKTMEEDETAFQEPCILTEEQVRFVPDSAAYLHPEEAEKTLAPIADYLREHPEVTLLLAGTIAGDSCGEKGLRLSEDRALAVRDTLLKLGADDAQLIVRGLGCSDPWHIYGVGTSGSAAAQNRKVVLLDASTAEARDILAE